ncbi:MAG: Signal transduction histidine kinase, partial [Candidatus Lokiarchaeum sp. GC14_75]
FRNPRSNEIEIFSRDFKNGGEYTGIGLGLLLIKRILEKYNGEITVKDRVKGDYTKGSKFIILIPEYIGISKEVEDMNIATRNY